jgi:hypothetical protein
MFACSSLLIEGLEFASLLLCASMRASSFSEEHKSVIGDRKLKVILQAVFAKKIRPPALQQCLVHSLLDRALGATKH